jgi:Gly-Xaa carboxypeptidase
MGFESKPLLSQADNQLKNKSATWSRIIFLIKVYFTFYTTFWLLPRLIWAPYGSVDASGECPQVNAATPSGINGELWANLSALYAQGSYEERAITWLSGAVRVPTETFDEMGPVGEDERWETRGPFHEYLLEEFPMM